MILLPLGCAIFRLICEVIPLHYDILICEVIPLHYDILICEVIPLHYDILICEVIPLHYDMLHVSDIRNIIATFKINSLKSTICFIRTLDLRVLTLAFYMPVLVIYGQLHLYYKPFTLK